MWSLSVGGSRAARVPIISALAGQRVHLLERGPLGSGASRAGMSHVVTWEEPEAHLELARASQRLYQRLCHELPDDIEYRQTGSIAVVDDPGLPGLAAMVGRLQTWGLDCQLLDSADLLRLEPALASGLAGGAYFPWRWAGKPAVYHAGSGASRQRAWCDYPDSGGSHRD
jgi:glycine/D-amino acid oxidase-like deaminating enzyme